MKTYRTSTNYICTTSVLLAGYPDGQGNRNMINKNRRNYKLCNCKYNLPNQLIFLVKHKNAGHSSQIRMLMGLTQCMGKDYACLSEFAGCIAWSSSQRTGFLLNHASCTHLTWPSPLNIFWRPHHGIFMISKNTVRLNVVGTWIHIRKLM